MTTYRKRLTRLMAATFLALPFFFAPVHAEDSVDLLTGSINSGRLVAPAETVSAKAPDGTADNAGASTATGEEDPLDQPLPGADGEAADAADPALEPVAKTPARAVQAGPDEVELAALYYYADLKQEDRVTAEAERLRAKYPDFELPKDLYADRNRHKVDEAPLWELYKKDDFRGIEALVAKLKVDNAGWEPSQDFQLKLQRRKLRLTLTDAYKTRDWVGMIAAANKINPQKEKDVDLLWMLIDAYREAKMEDQLIATYKAILFRPGKSRLPDALLVTTLQKATRDFEPGEVRSAMMSLWPNPGLITALKPINDDFIRQDVADFNNRSERQEPIAEKDIQRLRDLVAAKNATSDMSLLGWYFLKLKQPKEAEPYFTKALALKQTPEFAKGLYLSLAQQKRDEEAYALAAAHLKELVDDPQFLMNALSLRFAKPELGEVDPKTVEAYSSTILKTKSADHAEILAWYAYNSMQFQASEAWFVQAWNWEEEPNRLKGIALSFMHEGKAKEFAALRARFGDLYPDMWAEILNPQPLVQPMMPVMTIQPPQIYAQQQAYAQPQVFAQPQPQPMARPVVFRQPQVVASPDGQTEQVVYQVASASAAVPAARPIVYQSAPAMLPQPDPQMVYSVPQTQPVEPVAKPKQKPKKQAAARASSGGYDYLAAYRAKDYSGCLEKLNAMAQSGGLTAEAMLIRGWSYLALYRTQEARQSFNAALKGTGRTRTDAAYGSALAALRVNLTDEAEAVITAYPLDAAKDREVRAEIYWQRARSAFDHQDFQGSLDALNARLKLVPEPTNLTTLRAWAHYKLGNRYEARQIMTKLNMQITDPELQHSLGSMAQ